MLPLPTPTTVAPKRKRSIGVTTSTYKKRNDILQETKNDVKKYYADKLRHRKNDKNNRKRQKTIRNK